MLKCVTCICRLHIFVHLKKKEDKTDLWAIWLVCDEDSFPQFDASLLVECLILNSSNRFILWWPCGYWQCGLQVYKRFCFTVLLKHHHLHCVFLGIKTSTKWQRSAQTRHQTSSWEPMETNCTLESLQILKTQSTISTACLYVNNLYTLNKCMIYNITDCKTSWTSQLYCEEFVGPGCMTANTLDWWLAQLNALK